MIARPDRPRRPSRRRPAARPILTLLTLVALGGPVPGGAAAHDGFLRVSVVDSATHRPLEGVELRSRGGGATGLATTDAEGRAELDRPEAPPRGLTLWARRPGYVPITLEWPAPASVTPTVTIELEPGTSIGGLVRDEAGRPIAGATVFVLVPAHQPREPGRPRVDLQNHEAKTDDDGRWRCAIVPQQLDDVTLRLSHPDFSSDATFGTTPRPPLGRLRDGTGVMVMRRGIAVTGVVRTRDGVPVAGATVTQGADRFGTNLPEATTDAGGAFRFAHCRPGELILTVQGSGLAPDLRRVVVAPGLAPVEFALEPARTIRGRVVDAQGRPVAGAFVAADTWRGYRSIRFEVDTDADGRFTWTDAPADEVLFDFGRQGYQYVRKRAIRAGDAEITITMPRPLRVVGTVVDAATGAPVERFAVLEGIDWGNGQSPSFDRRRPRGATEPGRFAVAFDEPNPGHLVRVEADGYLPAVSRVVRDAEGEVAIDLKLQRGRDVAGHVHDRTGQPIPGASVSLLSATDLTFITNGRPPNAWNVPTVATDAAGRYHFPPQDGAFSLLVLDDRGYALRTSAQLAAGGDVALEPWGRVEGDVRIGSRPGAGETVDLNLNGSMPRDRIVRPYFGFEATADAVGHFAIDRVPPGDAWVSRRVTLSATSHAGTNSRAITVAPGATARVTIGGTGRPVIGRVVPPGGGQIDYSTGLNQIVTAPPEPSLLGALKALNRKTAVTTLTVRIEPDGTFRVDDVPPGEYLVKLAIAEPPVDDQTAIGEPVASLSHKFTMPEVPGGRSDEPLDLGTLELTMLTNVSVGQVAPDFEVPALEGDRPLRLADFRGKYVVLDFWATWCGPCVAETPHLRAAFAAHGADPRFALIGLSLDNSPTPARNYARRNGLTWAQGFLGPFGEAKLADLYGVRGIPSIWLIGPDGRIIAKDLRGEGIKAAVANALAAPR